MTSPIAGASRSRWRAVAYWGTTSVVAYEMVAGSMWDLLRIEYVREMLAHLGYPLYLLFILGAWKLPCAVVLLIPRLPRLKEWAYAGAFFNYSGAVASHVLVGDQPRMWIWAFGFAVLTLASWSLRPPERTLPAPDPEIQTRRLDWIVPIVVGFLMLVIALVTLPQGPPAF